MNFIGKSNIRVVLKVSYCHTTHLSDYLNDITNGVFNRVCYDVFTDNWNRSNDELDEFFLKCIQSAYRTAWGVLVKMDYQADWGTDDKDINKFLSPIGEVIEEPPIFCSAFLQTMLPILYHILEKVELSYDDEKRRNIKSAVCCQIRRKMVSLLGEYKYFSDLNEVFGLDRVDIVSISLENNYCESAIERAKFAALIADLEKRERRSNNIILTSPIRNKVQIKVKEYVEATNKEVNEAIRRIAPTITAKCHWNAIIVVLMNIPIFRKRIDEKYPHKEGKAKDNVKKFIVYEIAELLNVDGKKLYESVRHTASSYSHLQQQFRSILEEILTN